MDRLDTGKLPPLFPELEGLADNDDNSNSACFKDVSVCETEPVITVIEEGSSGGGGISIFERELSPFRHFLEAGPANNMRSSESPLPEMSSEVTAPELPLPEMGHVVGASQPGVVMPSSSNPNSQHSSLPVVFTAAPATTRSPRESRQVVERGWHKRYRDKKRDEKTDMEMRMPARKVMELRAESRKAAKLSPEAKIAQAVEYIKSVLSNNFLVKKYTAEKIARHIFANDKIKFSSNESQKFTQLRNKIVNLTSARESRHFSRIYFSKLQQATGNT